MMSKYAYKKIISPNSTNPRNKCVSIITPHHVAGKLNAEQVANIFKSPTRKASCTRVIGNDCLVVDVVDDNNRPWTSSSALNDHRAITYEVANSENGGDWKVSDAVLEKLIECIVDDCIVHDIPGLIFTGDKNGTLTQHNYFAATSCPGPYLKTKFKYIKDEVNKRLGVKVARIRLQKGDHEFNNLRVQYIKEMQQLLIKNGYDLRPYGADGKFGDATEKALKAFQTKKGLTANGLCGRKTWDALDEINKTAIVPPTNSSTGSKSSSEPVEHFKKYLVRTKIKPLSIRKGPGLEYSVTGSIKELGVYTIVDEVKCSRGIRWGKLKSGAGYIDLGNTVFVRIV